MVRSTFTFSFVQVKGGIHVHVVHHDALASTERRIVAPETLGNKFIVRMAELAEVMRPGCADGSGHLQVVLPAAHQAVALEAMVLQVKEVNLRAIQTNGAGPLVHLVVVLKPYGEYVVVVKILLQHHQVITFLRQVLADACRARVARPVGVDIHH